MVTGVKFTSAGVSIDGVRHLIVAALIEAAQVEPDFRDVRVDAYGPRICIKSITKLVDLEVEYANRAPEGRVPTVTVNSLLVGFVCLVVLLASHVSTTKKVPTLSICRV